MSAATKAGPLAMIPKADELSSWLDLLGDITGELLADGTAAGSATSKAPPAAGSEPAVMRAMQVQMLRLWLLALLNLRVQADAGMPVGTDPDAMLFGTPANSQPGAVDVRTGGAA